MGAKTQDTHKNKNKKNLKKRKLFARPNSKIPTSKFQSPKKPSARPTGCPTPQRARRDALFTHRAAKKAATLTTRSAQPFAGRWRGGLSASDDGFSRCVFFLPILVIREISLMRRPDPARPGCEIHDSDRSRPLKKTQK